MKASSGESVICDKNSEQEGDYVVILDVSKGASLTRILQWSGTKPLNDIQCYQTLKNMLACVYQPSDPNIFRKAAIISNEKTLKITNKEPKPGRTVRLKTELSEVLNSDAVTIEKIKRKTLNSVASLQSLKCSDIKTKDCSRDGDRGSDSSRSSPIKIYNDLNKESKKSSSCCENEINEFKACNISNEIKSSVCSKTPETISFNEIGIPTNDDFNHHEERRKLDDSGKKTYEKLPDGVQLTLSELREMACRQQSQIDSQHQLLAAKEQRLRYLKEQEARQQRVQAESERLRRLRDRVDAQELKLRKLRALRGQVDHQKQNNLSLTSDLDSIRALFNEKEKELSLAVAKVEELTRQLEELKRGRSSRDQPPASVLELDKLRRELMYRNKLNEQQNLRLNQQREALTARQEEMSAIDKRISELQERLHRKRLLNQQLANQISAASHKAAYHQLVRLTGNAEQNNQAFTRKQHQNIQQSSNGLSRGNIAAVEPYNHVPLQTGQPLRENIMQENTLYNTAYHPQSMKKDNDPLQNAYENQDPPPKIGGNLIPNRPEDIENFAVSKSDPKYQTLPYNTKFTVNLLSGRSANANVNINNNNNKLDINELKHIEKESEQQPNISTGVGIHNGNVNFSQPTGTTHMTVHSAPLNILNKNIATPLNHNDLVLSRRNSSEHGSVKDQLHGHQKITDQAMFNNMASPPPNINYQKPISSVAPTSIHHTGILSNVYQTSSMKVQPVEPQTTISSNKQLPSPLNGRTSNNTSGVSLVLSPPQSSSTPYNNTPEVSIEKISKPALPPKPAIKPPPRQTQHISQLTEEKNTHSSPVASLEPPEDIKASSVPQRMVLPPPIQPPRTNKEVTIEKLPVSTTSTNSTYHQSSSEMIIKAKPLTIKKQPFTEQPKLRNVGGYKPNGSVSRRIEIPSGFQYQTVEKPLDSPSSTDSRDRESNEKDEVDRAVTTEESADTKSGIKDEKPIDGVIRRCKKGNLKQSGKQNLSRRVSFDPLALLLDASLEGELELVKKTASQVANPSAANDEGITALHNAICAGHLEIVKFLVEFGCDVNAQDSDGWTPLHCGASCNNVAMVKFLVEHGACIFATTLSDHETAAEKCEEDEEGFDGCSEYLYSVQEKLGILSNGAVYAVFDYTAQQQDELSFKSGQQLTVLRKGDENEREWWWCRLGDKEGYAPRNLLGLYPRVIRSED